MPNPNGPYTPKRSIVKLFDRILGSATGWDGDPDVFWWYDFTPAEGIDLPAGILQIDFVHGHIGKVNEDDGKILDPKDIPSFLVNIPRKDS